MLRGGRWAGRRLIPADYVELCRRVSPYNPHCPFSLQFEVNADGHLLGVPRDAFFKSGAGGFCIYAVPSLDLAVYKMASGAPGMTGESGYDLAFGGGNPHPDASRDNWKPRPATQFDDGPINGDAGTRRTLEMVVAAIG
jgi:CubicO group peptidase (beta-lactamase class C family)